MNEREVPSVDATVHVEATDAETGKGDNGEEPRNAAVTMVNDDPTSKDSIEDSSNNNNTGCAVAWDYSSRRIILSNILKYEDTKKVTKAINNWLKKMKEKLPNVAVEVEKVRKPPKDKWAVVTFKAEEMCKPFLDFVNDSEDVVNKRGGKITARMADESNNKRKAELDDRFVPSKRQRRQDAPQARRAVTEEEIKDKITPLWRLSQEEQLETKMKILIRKCALKIVQEIKNRFRYVTTYTPVCLWVRLHLHFEVEVVVIRVPNWFCCRRRLKFLTIDVSEPYREKRRERRRFAFTRGLKEEKVSK